MPKVHRFYTRKASGPKGNKGKMKRVRVGARNPGASGSNSQGSTRRPY